MIHAAFMHVVTHSVESPQLCKCMYMACVGCSKMFVYVECFRCSLCVETLWKCNSSMRGCLSVCVCDDSDSSQRLALMNTSEEIGQARDTSTHVTFNALNSTSSPRILHSLLHCSLDARDEKIFKCSVRNKTSKLNFPVRDKISFVGAQAKVTPVAHGGRSCS